MLLLRKTDVLKHRFSKFKKICLQVSFQAAPTHSDITELYHFLQQLLRPKKNKKHSCFWKCGLSEKSSSRRPQFFFFNRFSGHILFSSLVSFAFSDSSLFFELKNVYSDTHWTMRGVSDKKFSPSRFQETRLLFFWSEFWEQNCMWLFCY